MCAISQCDDPFIGYGTIWNFVLEAFWLLYDFEPFSEQNSELGLCLGPFAC